MYELQRQMSWSALKVGAIISIAALVLFVTVLFSGNILSTFAPKVTLHANLGNIKGLRSGAPVWLYGVEIGKVNKIRLSSSGTIISFSIEKKELSLIPSDSKVQVLTMGLMGDKFIEIEPGTTDAQQIKPESTLKGTVTQDLDKLVASGSESFDQINQLIGTLDTFLLEMRKSDGTVNQLISNPDLYNRVSDAARSISRAAQDLNKAQGTYRRFVEDPELYNNLNKTMFQLSNVLTSIDSGKGLIGSALNDSTLKNQIHSTVDNINSLIADMKVHPKKYFNLHVF